MKIDRDKVWKKYEKHCAYCGEVLKDSSGKYMQVDHIYSKSQAWWDADYYNNHLDKIENLNPSCIVCNIRKGSGTIEKFRERIMDDMRILRERNSKYRFALKYGLIKEDIHPIIFYFERKK